MATNITTTAQKSIAQTRPSFSVFMSKDNIKKLVSNAVGKNAQRFTTAIISAVSNNPALQECEQSSVLSGALLGEALNLSPSPQLGQYYLVPFKKKDRQGRVVEVKAQFILGAKGYKQLAIRSGVYTDIDVFDIKQGEYKGRDPYTGKHRFEFIEDPEAYESLPTIGYMAYFELQNGFRKTVYWSKEKMLKHADTYSQAFNAKDYERYIKGDIPANEMYKYSSFWYKNFDEMAHKTLIRNLLSQWGILSTELEKAITSDNAVIDEQLNATYVDVVDELQQAEQEATPTEEQPTEAEQAEFDFFGGDEKAE